MRHRAIVMGLLALLCAGFRPADGLSEAETLYTEGAFREAAVIARDLENADGYALAAKAALVEGSYAAAGKEQLELFRRAAGDARKALALDPAHVDAHLQLAVALGRIAERKDPITAHVQGYAKRGKALLDDAMALDPDYGWTHGLLGVWHLQVVRHAGPTLAKELYGASEQAGLEHCAKADERAPGALVLKFGCAVSLLHLEDDTHDRAAIDRLKAITRGSPDDAAERLVRREARKLLGRHELSARSRPPRPARAPAAAAPPQDRRG